MSKFYIVFNETPIDCFNDRIKDIFYSIEEAWSVVQDIRRAYINSLKENTLAHLVWELDYYSQKELFNTAIKLERCSDTGDKVIYRSTQCDCIAEAIKEIVMDMDAVKNLKLADTSILEYCLMSVLNQIGDLTKSSENSVDEERIVDSEQIVDEDIPF